MQLSQKLSVTEKIGFGAGDMAVNISLMSISMLLTYFYTDIFGLDPVDMGLLFLVVRIFDAFVDPVMGWITDKVVTKYGRYRHWFGLGALPFGISIFLLFYTPDISYTWKLAFAWVAYIFNQVMFSVVTIPYISLIGVITNDPAERLSANGYRFVMAKSAALLVITFVPLLAMYLAEESSQVMGYAMAMGLMAILTTLSFWFCFFLTKERVAAQISVVPLKTQFRHIIKNDQWIVLVTACVLMMTAFLLRGGIGFHYAKYYVQAEGSSFSVFMSMWSIGGILATVVSTWLTRYFCKVKVFKYSMLLSALLGVAMYYCVQPGDIWAGIIFYFLFCFLSDLNTPIFWSSITEVVDYGEKKTGVRVTGLALGSISFFQKFGMGVAGWLSGILLAFYNYQPGVVQSARSLEGINIMMTLIPAALFFTVYLVMNKFIISNEYYNNMMSHEA